MGILSRSINLLSKPISKFTSNWWVTPPVAVSDLKRHNNSKLEKLLVMRKYKGSTYYSRLSADHNLNNNDLDFTFARHSHHFIPIASCNSLVLSLIDFDSQAALWNPTTDEIKALPRAFVSRPPSAIQTLIAPYGFGFDRASEDYKVIRFLDFEYEDGDAGKLSAELYSLKYDSWKEISYPPFGIPLQEFSVHINGFYYWIAFDRHNFILSFDFANEKFSSIPLPETDKLGDDLFNIRLGDFGGSLAALVFEMDDRNNLVVSIKTYEFELWVWNDGSWTRVPEIDHVPDVVGIHQPLGLFNNDQLYLQGTSRGELLVFDCAKRELKNLGLNSDILVGGIDVFPYVESKEPIKSFQNTSYNDREFIYDIDETSYSPSRMKEIGNF